MTELAQIVCPHCRNTLRIPAAWADQPLRCKFCQKVFQARKKAGGIASGTTAPMAKPAKGNSLGAPAAVRSSSSRKPAVSGALPMRAVLLGCLVLFGAGVAGVVIIFAFGNGLLKMFPDNAAQKQDTKKETPLVALRDQPEPQDFGKGDLKVFPNADKISPDKGPKNKDKVASEPNKGFAELIFAEPQPKKESSEKAPPDLKKGPTGQDKVQADPKKGPPDNAKKGPKEKAKGPPDQKKGPAVAPDVRQILNELAVLPPATGGKATPIDTAGLPAFAADVLEAYKPDYAAIRDFKDKEAEFPLRAAVVRAFEALTQDNAKGPNVRRTIAGDLKDKALINLKNQAKNEQEAFATKAVILKDLVKEMGDIGDKYHAGETKRWQVLFDYVSLRLKARVVFVVEYNFNLAQIRTDSLPPLEKEDKLYRLTAQEKVTVNEAYIKQYVKDLKKGWTNLAKSYPDTPWAVLAPREQAVLLGLSWQSAKSSP